MVFYEKTFKGVIRRRIRRNNKHFLKKHKYEKLRLSEMNLLNNFFFSFSNGLSFQFCKNMKSALRILLFG